MPLECPPFPFPPLASPCLALAGTAAPAEPLLAASKPSWMLVDVLFPDGRTTTVRSTCPVGAEGYVHAAVQFRGWASKPYDVRLQECEHALIEQEKVEIEISRIQRHLVSAQSSGAHAIDPAHLIAGGAPPAVVAAGLGGGGGGGGGRGARLSDDELSALWLPRVLHAQACSHQRFPKEA